MSFVFKALLGQSVVHPVKKDTKEEGEPGEAAKGEETTKDRKEVVATLGSPTVNNIDQASPPAPAAPSSPAAAPPAKVVPKEPMSTTPVATLLTRLRTCVVMQDKRNALRELERAPELPYALAPTEMDLFFDIIEQQIDPDMVSSALLIVDHLTDVEWYPSTSQTLGGAVSEREKRQYRDTFLAPMEDRVALLVSALNVGFTQPDRLHAIRVLHRLEEFNSSTTHQKLLTCHGLGTIADLLSDPSHDVALQKEVLALLNVMTMMDPELQTILAFENGFEALFQLIKNADYLQGGELVTECLTIMHNLLRGNKSTRKVFLDMGFASRLCPLLNVVHETVARLKDKDRSGSGKVTEPMPLFSLDASFLLLKGITLLSCVLKEAESEGTVAAARDGLLQAGLLHPLLSLALCGVAVDVGTRIEALRVLTRLVSSSARGIQELLRYPVYTLLGKHSDEVVLVHRSALRSLLDDLLASEDSTLLIASVGLVEAVLSEPSCHGMLINLLLSGFGPTSDARTLTHECGAILAHVLFFSSTSPQYKGAPRGKYYAAHLLRHLLLSPSLAERLLAVPWVSQEAANRRDGAEKRYTLPHNSTVVFSQAVGPNFFNAFCSYVCYCIKGGFASEGMDTAVVAAYMRVLFAWLGTSPTVLLYFVAEPSWLSTLLSFAAREGSVHIRLWCACLAAHVCLLMPPVADTSAFQDSRDPYFPPLRLNTTKEAMVQQFINTLGGSSFFDTLLMDVAAGNAQWSQPVANAFSSPTNAVYDAGFKNELQGCMHAFRSLCPTESGKGAGLNAEMSPVPFLPETAPLLATRVPLSNNASATGAPPGDSSQTMKAIRPEFEEPLTVPAVTDRVETQLHVAPREGQNSVLPAVVSLVYDGEGAMDNMDYSRSNTTVSPNGANTDVSITAFQADSSASVGAHLAAVGTDSELRREANRWKEIAAERETKIEALQQELSIQQERGMQLEALENEAKRGSQSETENLKETIQLLEEALASKQEEQEQMMQSMNAMSAQLQRAAAAAQQQQQQQQQQQLRSPPPAPAAPQVDEAILARLHDAEAMVAQLQQELADALADKEELLTIVGEMSMECETHHQTPPVLHQQPQEQHLQPEQQQQPREHHLHYQQDESGVMERQQHQQQPQYEAEQQQQQQQEHHFFEQQQQHHHHHQRHQEQMHQPQNEPSMPPTHHMQPPPPPQEHQHHHLHPHMQQTDAFHVTPELVQSPSFYGDSTDVQLDDRQHVAPADAHSGVPPPPQPFPPRQGIVSPLPLPPPPPVTHALQPQPQPQAQQQQQRHMAEGQLHPMQPPPAGLGPLVPPMERNPFPAAPLPAAGRNPNLLLPDLNNNFVAGDNVNEPNNDTDSQLFQGITPTSCNDIGSPCSPTTSSQPVAGSAFLTSPPTADNNFRVIDVTNPFASGPNEPAGDEFDLR